MKDGIKGLTKIQYDYIYYLPFINQVGEFIIEGDQITKAELSLDKMVLTMSENSFVL